MKIQHDLVSTFVTQPERLAPARQDLAVGLETVLLCQIEVLKRYERHDQSKHLNYMATYVRLSAWLHVVFLRNVQAAELRTEGGVCHIFEKNFVPTAAQRRCQ